MFTKLNCKTELNNVITKHRCITSLHNIVIKQGYVKQLHNTVMQRQDETLYRAGVLALYQTKVRRSGGLYQTKAPICQVRQARQVPARATPGQGLYTGVGAGAGAGAETGAGAGAELQLGTAANLT